MIKDLHVNEFGCMEGIFYSDILGYDVKVMYKKYFTGVCGKKYSIFK